MDQRVAFMADWLRDEWTMTELAERYGISRKTAYKWVARYDGGSRARASRAIARAEGARSRDGRRSFGEAVLALRRRASALGARRNCGRCSASETPRSAVAGDEHDGRSAAARGTQCAAATARGTSCR